MGPLTDWLGDFDPGEFLGVGLDTRQLGHLAGALFLGLFAVSALRRAGRAGGPVAALWLAVAIGLLAAAVSVAGRGFPDQVPEDLRTWAEPDRLARAAAVLILLGFSVVLTSAYWVRRPLRRLAFRLVGLSLAGLALWLAAGWFGDSVPDELRPWTARTTVTRSILVLALLCLSATFWFRPAGEPAHAKWAARALMPACLAIAGALADRWFAPAVSPEIPVGDVNRIGSVLAAVATGTCVLIAGGAFLMRDRPVAKPERSRPDKSPAAPRPTVVRRLPVAVLLDEHGPPLTRPSPDPASQAGPAGA
jgi:hypothetical protein